MPIQTIKPPLHSSPFLEIWEAGTKSLISSRWKHVENECWWWTEIRLSLERLPIDFLPKESDICTILNGFFYIQKWMGRKYQVLLQTILWHVALLQIVTLKALGFLLPFKGHESAEKLLYSYQSPSPSPPL